MGPLNEEIIKAIHQYQERLERYILTKSEEKILYVIQKLGKLPIKTSHLETTGVGRTVNALKKFGGKVSDSAKDLVMSWKEMVLEEEKSVQKPSTETEEEADSTYSDNEGQNQNQNGRQQKLIIQSEIESDSDHYNMKEISSKSKNLDSKTSRFLDFSKNSHKNHSSVDSSSEEEQPSRHSRKRDLSQSSSDEEIRHKSKKSKREKEKENSINSSHKEKSKSSKDEKERLDKKEKHSSSSKSKGDRSQSKHKSNRDSESNNKSEKHKKHEDKTEKNKKSSHSSSSSHSNKKENKDKKEKDKHDSKNENFRSKSPEKKSKEIHKEEKKSSKLKDSYSKSKNKSSSSENGVRREKKDTGKSISKEKILNGIDSESGASFAEALGMCGPVSSQTIKKKSSSERKSSKVVEIKLTDPSTSRKNKYEESSTSSSSQNASESLVEELPEPVNICLSSLLPEITPNYKPTPIHLDVLNLNKRFVNDDEALSRVMSNKNQRTKVYSGNKTVGKLESLFQLCVRVLQDNIDALEYTGGVPYMILKPILERATPDQLFNMEHHNPYLIEDTDELWQLHCQKEFRNKKREELESWREMYMRCLDERERRLNFITANIKQSQDKSEPVRTTKMAYVDSEFVKPPRNIARKQAKNGTVATDRKILPSQKLSNIAKPVSAEKVSVPNPGSRVAERSSNSSSAIIKPKKAPLMAKTLSFLKNRFKR